MITSTTKLVHIVLAGSGCTTGGFFGFDYDYEHAHEFCIRLPRRCIALRSEGECFVISILLFSER